MKPRAAPAVLFATDLDQTLIYSARSAPSPGALLTDDEVAALDLRVVEHKDGEPLSYVTARTQLLLREVRQRCLLVPVTTRTLAQYRRVTGIAEDLAPVWAVTTNGANVLHDGVVDPDWRRAVEQGLAERCRPLAEVADAFSRLAAAQNGAAWLRELRIADDAFLYALVEPPSVPDDLVEQVRAAVAPDGWVVSYQGRKLYLVPAAVEKRAAVAHVRERSGAGLLVAAGDSLLDRPLLEAADVALRPAHGELHARGWDGAVVTAASGARAAEELLERVLALVDRQGRPPPLTPSAVAG